MSMTIEVPGLTLASARAAIAHRSGVLAHGWTVEHSALSYANPLTGTELGGVADAPAGRGLRVEMALARPPWYGVEALAALADVCAAVGVDWDTGPVLEQWRRHNQEAVAIEADLGIPRWEATETDARRWYDWQMSQPHRRDDVSPFSPNLLWLLDPRQPRSRARLTFTWNLYAAFLPRVDALVVRHDGMLRLLDWDDLSAAVGHLMEPVSVDGSGEAYLIDIDHDEAAEAAGQALLASGAGAVVDPGATALDGGQNIRAERLADPAA